MAEEMTDQELMTRIGEELRASLGYFSDELSNNVSWLWSITTPYPLVTK